MVGTRRTVRPAIERARVSGIFWDGPSPEHARPAAERSRRACLPACRPFPCTDKCRTSTPMPTTVLRRPRQPDPIRCNDRDRALQQAQRHVDEAGRRLSPIPRQTVRKGGCLPQTRRGTGRASESVGKLSGGATTSTRTGHRERDIPHCETRAGCKRPAQRVRMAPARLNPISAWP